MPELKRSQTRKNLITYPPKSNQGSSLPMVVGGRVGQFQWGKPPTFDKNIGKGKTPLYEFTTADEQKFRFRLEKDKQGGRWEAGEFAEEEYKQYFDNPGLIVDDWGQSDVGETLREAVLNQKDFLQLPKLLKNLNTWRQISGD